MGNEATSEGYMGDGKPTDDRMSVDQIVDFINLHGDKIPDILKDKLELLIERAKELEKLTTVSIPSVWVEEPDGKVPPGNVTITVDDAPKKVYGVGGTPQPCCDKCADNPLSPLTYLVGEYAADIVSQAVEDSRKNNEAFTAEGRTLAILDFIVALARDRLKQL
jgi:hypothetical protein